MHYPLHGNRFFGILSWNWALGKDQKFVLREKGINQGCAYMKISPNVAKL